jgi:hypothetical protein
MTTRMNGGPLRQTLQDARGPGVSMSDLTVLAAQNDPYRVDTPAGHRDAEWLATQIEWALGGRERLHLRGIHYSIVTRGDVLKPNGEPYRNTDADWTWLQAQPSKAARWLGYVPFDSIADNRNDPPIIYRPSKPEPRSFISVGVEVHIPDVDELEPQIGVVDFEARQPYHTVMFGEKSSLADVLVPIAEQYGADLYLPTGEISDTLMHLMAKDANQDGRPMLVFTLADCDPAGHQMPVSIGRKLQALRDLLFPDLEFEVRPIALTVDQAIELGLPSTPLKESEARAEKWRAAFGVEQTEIDALATLQPEVLRAIVLDAITPFRDATLRRRVFAAQMAWLEKAQANLDSHTDDEFLGLVRAEAAEKLLELKDEIERLNESLRQSTPADLDLPPIEIPEPVIDTSLHGVPLVSSSWPWTEQTRRLIERKSYGNGAG